MDTSVYYTQCMSGHVLEVIPGGELEKKCKARADQGYLDAFILNTDECPDCVEDGRERERRNANMCGDCGCPFMSLSDEDDKCAQGCMFAKAYREIEDSPFDGQLRGLSYNATYATHADVHELV